MADLRVRNGGARAKAGRKPIEDKKRTITVYLRQSYIDSIGGIEAVKNHIYSLTQR